MSDIAKPPNKVSIQRFAITLDDAAVNPHAIYRPGQTVKFKVHLNLLELIKCRFVRVNVSGKSRVFWVETRTVRSGNSTTTNYYPHESEDVYIDDAATIFSSVSGGTSPEGHHPAGEFVYPGTLTVPPEAPSSFEGFHGRVRYVIRASIERPSGKAEKYTQKLITVLRDLDLNSLSPEEVGPVSTDSEFRVTCCVCTSRCCGTLRAGVALQRRAFVPGESVNVTGEIFNGSKVHVRGASLELTQSVTYRSGRDFTSSQRVRSRVAATVQLPEIPRGQSMKFNHFLPVGPLPCSYLEGCKNMLIQYFIRVNADGGDCLLIEKDCCELILGSVPLWNATPELPAPLQEQPLSQLHPPTPTYQECLFGRVDSCDSPVKCLDDQTQWAPSYPVFFLTSAATNEEEPVAGRGEREALIA